MAFTEPTAVCVMLRNLWRASLLALGCAAAPIIWQPLPIFVSAAHSSGSKLPRHKSRCIETPD
ncbi:hypothetical protein C5612_14875 [Pseudomonas frederiksbergensis]|uniref:Uncharacterized protein n=1 Tax=Pseudomonas frederiksbergensis TaxID=104087 RepID=A0A2S8HKR2_9PSED|nr:hypothetical protein C5612_14875 [Pseudomonas frederiksbergensis]